MTPDTLSASKLAFGGRGFQPQSSRLESPAFAEDRRRSHRRDADLLERVYHYSEIMWIAFIAEQHESKIDFVARAKALGYEIILVYIHLDTPALNEARVHQRVAEGGHYVPAEKTHTRIPRTMKHVAAVLPLVNEARLLNNSSRKNPYRQVAVVKRGRRTKAIDPLPNWAEEILRDIP
ncbi:MAG TPA: hypothetical protein VLT56_08315 [Desulfobacterales bacterium]|nr:hypothetical protein [Desulfobacterales bacterium]